MPKRSAGLVYLIPLLVVAFVAISVLALSIQPKSQKTGENAVLSESESGGGGDNHSGFDSSGSGSSEGSNTATRPVATLKPKETEEPDDKVENEVEDEAPEIEDENEVEVHEGTQAARVKIGRRENRFTFFEQRFGAESEFPVSVNSITRELTIETPQGIRVVAVLPDAAVENMIGQNVIDKILGVNGQLVEIKVDENGNVFYEISGEKDKKLFGIFNVAIPKTIEVSTQTGDLTNTDQSTFSQILEALSF